MTTQILKFLHSSKTQKSEYRTNETISSSNKKIHLLFIDSYCMTKKQFSSGGNLLILNDSEHTERVLCHVH